jgi:hypothetical protein
MVEARLPEEATVVGTWIVRRDGGADQGDDPDGGDKDKSDQRLALAPEPAQEAMPLHRAALLRNRFESIGVVRRPRSPADRKLVSHS